MKNKFREMANNFIIGSIGMNEKTVKLGLEELLKKIARDATEEALECCYGSSTQLECCESIRAAKEMI